MTGELVLSVLQGSDADRGHVAGLAVTDQMIVAVGGTSDRSALVVASSDARHFEPRATPRGLGLRGILAVGDSLWACGERGQLAVSRDHAGHWQLLETGTEGCLLGLAVGSDGAIWVVGEAGYAARVLGERPRQVELGTGARLASVHAVRDEVVMLGGDGRLVRWREGKLTTVACGATRALSALAVTSKGTWVVVGAGGFVARSPDGAWYSRVDARADVDLEAIGVLPDGSLVIVGDRGQLLRSTDDARTWQGIATELGLVHLWSIERFGGGALIGGDHGLILKLAPADDTTWSERTNVFGGAKPLDAVFAAGPEGFIANGLALYLEAAGGELEDDDGADGDGDGGDSDGGGGGDGGGGSGDDALPRAGDAEEFRSIYGVALPNDARRLFELVAGRARRSRFDELRPGLALRPDAGAGNLFELMVRRDQRAYLGTELVEAFAGVFGIGSQGNGDTYHLEVHEGAGRRQVLHLDHETAAFTGVFADSLDSLVYLAALVKAGDGRAISPDAYTAGLRRLRGKVAPTWQFSIDEKDPGFVALEPGRLDTELLFYRSRWICALLRNDGVTDLDDLRALFDPALNPVVAAGELAARFEACEKLVPAALYALWRAYLFDEPELARYLEIARQHAARIVRDAGALIDELRGGRTELGTIGDVRGWLAAFRALDLDPRRAEQRAQEAGLRAHAARVRRAAREAELDRTPPDRWAELAWQWLDDGAAHRALLSRLDRTQGAQIAAIDELREATDDERAIALPRLAAELSPELEAVLVGSLVRDDALEGVVVRPSEDGDGADDDDDGDEDDDDDRSPGWEAIDRALAPIYGDAEPLHYGTVVPYELGGNDPIHGISVYQRADPRPHWHFVTYGFTDLFRKQTDDSDHSGHGFELTLRLARAVEDAQPPTWALNFLQNLGRYVFGTGNPFAAGHKMGLNGPIALDHATAITAICFADDPELGELSSEFGRARFVQIVGITDDEYKLIQEWSTTGLVEILTQHLPLLVTDLGRGSVLDDPATAAVIRERVDREGSSEDLTFAGELKIDAEGGQLRVELGALYAATLPRAMRGRIRHGRRYELRGRQAALQLEPSDALGYRLEDSDLVLELTPELASEIEAALRHAVAGTYRFAAWPRLTIVVTPSIIRGQDGSATEVRGVADPAEVERIITDDNARRAAGSRDDADDDDDDDDGSDGDDDGGDAEAGEAGDDDDDAPAPAQLAQALAMTGRALRLAPGDEDVQFAHAMLLLDAERAGDPAKADELLARLAVFVPQVRINVAVRMARADHPRFGEVVELVLAEPLPAQILGGATSRAGMAMISSFGDMAPELFGELGEAILERSPREIGRLVPLLPDDAKLLSELAHRAIAAGQRDTALVLYDRVVAVAIPDGGDERTVYLRALNNACVQAHAAGAFDAAARLADRAQGVAHDNPYLYHAAACAYVAINEHARAFEQVKLAVEHDYEHTARMETDADLGPLLDWPELKALFRDWHARREGN